MESEAGRDAAAWSTARIDELVGIRAGQAGHGLDAAVGQMYQATIQHLPAAPCTVLDVGCGTGILADVMNGLGYETLGIDINSDAMSTMTSPHQVGSVAALPFDREAFEVVVANEILEHLPVTLYGAGIMEMARVAGRRIIVTVPNAEALDSSTTRCPECGCVYSSHGHVRRFEPRQMASLFPGFALIHLATAGPYKLRHRSIEWYVRRRLLGRWPAAPGRTCPQCGARQQPASSRKASDDSRLRRVVKLLAGVPWKRWWIVAVYERVGGGMAAGTAPARDGP
jgi:SAM-dependent methyltransferase